MKEKNIRLFVNLFVSITTIASVILINYIHEKNWWFLLLLSINLTVTVGFYSHISETLKSLSARIAGLVFIFSGIVKGIDPWGNGFKMGDYFEAMNLEFLHDYALPLGMLLIVAEFVLGFAVFFKIKLKISSIFIFLFMAFFTPLTLWLAVANPVSDCGCFGDFIIMSNWQTFYKNFVLLIPILIILLHRKNMHSGMKNSLQTIIVAIGLFLICGTSFLAIRHLPSIDFRPYKIGNSMLMKQDKVIATFKYKNKQTGEEVDFEQSKLPWNDSIWMNNHEFISSGSYTLKDSNKQVHSPLFIVNAKDEEVRLEDKGYQLLIVMYKTDDAKTNYMKDVKKLSEEAFSKHFSIIGLCGSTAEDIATFSTEHQIDFPVYLADDIALKTVVRSNPGLVLLKNGTIIKKWSCYDLPSLKEIEEKGLIQ